VGYIDCDSHVIEVDHTWDFFDPGEEPLRPGISDNYWTVGDLFMQWPGPMMSRWMNDVFPRGSCERSDPSARLS
jgi:hypothetical protein